MNFSEFSILIETITSKSSSIYFSISELESIFEEICKNGKNNSPLHMCRMFSYNGRIISIAELMHYIKISNTTGFNLAKDIRTFDHLMAIRSSAEKIVACMFTSHPTTNFPGCGQSSNFKLTNNSFKYATRIVKARPVDFYSYFSISHDVNNFPKSIVENPNEWI